MYGSKKVIIIGGGIAGLALAKALSQVEIQCSIFEKAREIRNIGGGITIYPQGFLALRSLGLSESAIRIAHEIQNYLVYDGDCLLMQASLKEFRETIGVSLYSFSRHELQTLLAKSLPRNTMHLGAEVVKIESYESQTRVFFTDGSYQEADLVVVANGVNSSFFSELVTNAPNDKKYCGYAFWGGFLSDDQLIELDSNTMASFLGTNKTAFVLTLPNQRQWFYLVAKISDPNDLAEGKNLKMAKRLFSNWSKIIDKILACNEDAFQFCLPVYELQFKEIWSRRRVVGIGDAVHAVGPTAGQGASAAMIDALTLARCIGDSADIDQGLRTYHKARTPGICHLYDIEKKSAESKMAIDFEQIQNRNNKYQTRTILEIMRPIANASKDYNELFRYFENKKINN